MRIFRQGADSSSPEKSGLESNEGGTSVDPGPASGYVRKDYKKTFETRPG
jgi:hypothetical protein